MRLNDTTHAISIQDHKKSPCVYKMVWKYMATHTPCREYLGEIPSLHFMDEETFSPFPGSHRESSQFSRLIFFSVRYSIPTDALN